MKHERRIDFSLRDKFHEKGCVAVCDIIVFEFIKINADLKREIFGGVYAQMGKKTSVNGRESPKMLPKLQMEDN
jgi:hypothetical protein